MSDAPEPAAPLAAIYAWLLLDQATETPTDELLAGSPSVGAAPLNPSEERHNDHG